jgi:hypothetical protein
VEDGGDGWLVSAVVARVVCAASARVRRGMLSGGQRCGQRGDGVVAQEEAIASTSRGAPRSLCMDTSRALAGRRECSFQAKPAASDGVESRTGRAQLAS